jgi:hypothetical protein
MTKDSNNLFESYKLILEKKSKVNPYAVCTSKVGRKDKKKYNKCIKGVEKVSSEDDAETTVNVAEASEFLNRLASRLLADNSSGFTNEDVHRLKEIASKLV